MLYIYILYVIYIFNTPVNLIILHQPVFSFKKKRGDPQSLKCSSVVITVIAGLGLQYPSCLKTMIWANY